MHCQILLVHVLVQQTLSPFALPQSYCHRLVEHERSANACVHVQWWLLVHTGDCYVPTTNRAIKCVIGRTSFPFAEMNRRAGMSST